MVTRRAPVVLVFLAGLGLQGCRILPSGTPESAPSPGTVASTASPAPEELVTTPLLSVAYRFGPEIPAPHRTFIRQAVEHARTVFVVPHPRGSTYEGEVFSFADYDRLVGAYAEETGTSELAARQEWDRGFAAVTPVQKLFLFTPRLFDSAPGADSAKDVEHEVFHILQQKLSNRHSVTDPTWVSGPVWLFEGAAEYAGIWAVAERGLWSLAEALASRHETAAGEDTPLPRLSFQHAPTDEYDVAAAAVDLLVDSRSPRRLLRFYEELGRRTVFGGSWQEAFRQVFGISPRDFYARLEAARG